MASSLVIFYTPMHFMWAVNFGITPVLRCLIRLVSVIAAFTTEPLSTSALEVEKYWSFMFSNLILCGF